MAAQRHGIIRISAERDAWKVTARARCACGSWRQAGSFSGYPGEAGAILLTTQRFDCGTGPLALRRIARPFPADPPSLERAAEVLDRRSGELRAQAARLLRQAEEYEAGSERLRGDLRALAPEPGVSRGG